MKRRNLIQYIFEDDSETITTPDGTVVVVRESGTDYLPLDMYFKPRVRGSIPELGSSEFSRIPRTGEYLLTARFLGFGQRSSVTPIREINLEFQLS